MSVSEVLEVWQKGDETPWVEGSAVHEVSLDWFQEFSNAMEQLRMDSEKGCLDCEDGDPRPWVNVTCPNCGYDISLRINVSGITLNNGVIAVRFHDSTGDHRCNA